MDAGMPPDESESYVAAASDRAGDEASGRPRAGLGSRIDLGGLLGEAWSTFKATWPACLILYWGACAASWLMILLLQLTLASLNVLAGDREITPILEFILFLGLFLVPAWLWIGQTLAFLKIARRQPVALEDLFHGGPWLLTVLLAAGILAAVVAVPGLLIYGSAEALLALGGGDTLALLVQQRIFEHAPVPLGGCASDLLVLTALSLAVVGLSYAAFLVVSVRLGQFAYLIIDEGAGVVGSHRRSWALTRGQAATVFLVYLAQLAINLAGLLVFYVGLFVTLPLTSLISAVTYQVLLSALRSNGRESTRAGEPDVAENKGRPA